MPSPRPSTTTALTAACLCLCACSSQARPAGRTGASPTPAAVPAMPPAGPAVVSARVAAPGSTLLVFDDPASGRELAAVVYRAPAPLPALPASPVTGPPADESARSQFDAGYGEMVDPVGPEAGDPAVADVAVAPAGGGPPRVVVRLTPPAGGSYGVSDERFGPDGRVYFLRVLTAEDATRTLDVASVDPAGGPASLRTEAPWTEAADPQGFGFDTTGRLVVVAPRPAADPGAPDVRATAGRGQLADYLLAGPRVSDAYASVTGPNGALSPCAPQDSYTAADGGTHLVCLAGGAYDLALPPAGGAGLGVSRLTGPGAADDAAVVDDGAARLVAATDDGAAVEQALVPGSPPDAVRLAGWPGGPAVLLEWRDR